MTRQNRNLFYILYFMLIPFNVFSQDEIPISSEIFFSSVEDYFRKAELFEFDITVFYPRIELKKDECFFVYNPFSYYEYELGEKVNVTNIKSVNREISFGFLKNQWNDDSVSSIPNSSSFRIYVDTKTSILSLFVWGKHFNLPVNVFGLNTLSVYLLHDIVIVRDQFSEFNYLINRTTIDEDSMLERIYFEYPEQLLGVNLNKEVFSSNGKIVYKKNMKGELISYFDYGKKYGALSYSFFDFDSDKVFVSQFDPSSWKLVLHEVIL